MFAGVALLDEDANALSFVAKAGKSAVHSQDFKLIIDPKIDDGRGAAGRAVRNKVSIVRDDVEADAILPENLERARAAGIRSSLTIPIMKDGVVIGVLVVYAASPEAFGKEEISIFEGLVDELNAANQLQLERERTAASEIARLDAENEVKKQIERHKATIDGITSMVYGLDFEGRLLYLNEAGRKFIKKYVLEEKSDPNDDYIGVYLFDTLPPTPGFPLRNMIAKAMTERTMQTTQYFNPDIGSWFNTTVVPTDYGITAYTQDISDQRGMEQRLNHRQRLEAVGQLAGGVAHDFNNLLTVIIGNAELLADDPTLTARQVKWLDGIAKAADHGSELTQRLLAFSRNQELSPKWIEVSTVISSTQLMVNRLMGQQVHLRYNIEDNLQSICVDPAQLEIVMMNLCINARDAMPDGGNIAINVKNYDHRNKAPLSHFLDDVPAGQYLSITVQDEGSGMPPDILTRVFEPFFTTKEPGQGTGLGLSMIYGFIRQSNGYIAIESKENVGTTVTMLFPSAVLPAGSVAPTPAQETSNAGSERILLIEDNEQVGEFTKTTLETLGYQVSMASNADDAIKAIETEEVFDLVISDIMLPGGTNGIALSRGIRQIKPDTKFIFISGFADSVVTQEGLKLSDINLLPKPFTRKDLAGKIRKALVDDARDL